MRNSIRYTSFILLLTLLGAFLFPGITVSADEPAALAPVGQQVISTPTELKIISREIVTQPMLAAPTSNIYHTTVADAAAELRTALIERKNSYTVGIKTGSYSEAYANDLMNSIMLEALSHTGNPKEGDYLRWHFGGCYMSGGGRQLNGTYYLTFTFSDILYYTTLQQEAEVDAAVAALLDQLDVWNESDYEKTKTIYDYICSHITYDYDGLDAYNNGSNDYTPFSAWKAIIKGTSVCQGYANLFYRLMLELRVDNRMITGIGVTSGGSGGHAWNIVKLDGLYYNLDATWDAEYVKWDMDYEYFLRSPANFTDHIRDSEYETAAFHDAYPMDEEDYQPVKAVPGDMNGDKQVSDADALYLLRHTLFPERYPITTNGDVNSDGRLSDSDALYLLRHTLFPERYPLYPAA